MSEMPTTLAWIFPLRAASVFIWSGGGQEGAPAGSGRLARVHPGAWAYLHSCFDHGCENRYEYDLYDHTDIGLFVGLNALVGVAPFPVV